MLKIGHRGASATSPENTLTAFRKTMALGANGIELDVHRCKSGELVVIHDDTVDRTTGGTGKVAEMTLARLQSLQIGADEHIPTLKEVMEALGPAPYYFVEIKHADAALESAALLNDYREKGWDSEKLILISFQHAALREAREAFPKLRIGASFDRLIQNSVDQAEDMGAWAILPNYRNFTEGHMRAARDAGLNVIAWTVNDRVDITRTRLMGVQGIISDYPDRLVASA